MNCAVESLSGGARVSLVAGRTGARRSGHSSRYSPVEVGGMLRLKRKTFFGS